MSPVALDMTVSLDGFVTAPNDGPGRGLGDDGEVLDYWVFGGPWTYDRRTNREATGVDKQVLADGWDGSSPFGPCIVLTHRVEERPDPASGFEFVSGVEAAAARSSVSWGCGSISSAVASASRPPRRTSTFTSSGDHAADMMIRR